MAATIFFSRVQYPEDAAALDLLEPQSDAAIIGVDLANPSQALAALIAARRAGKATAVYPLLPDPLREVYAAIGRAIASTADPEQRRAQIEALRTGHLQIQGRKPRDFATYPHAALNAAKLALRVADVVLLGAPGEIDRWNAMTERPVRRFCLLPVPGDAPAASLICTAVTLYAPHTNLDDLAHYVMLLRDRGVPSHIIAADGGEPEIRTRVVIAPEGLGIQTRTIAARGHQVVAPNAMRVEECDTRIFGFALHDYGSFMAAVDAARACTNGAERITVSPSTVAGIVDSEQAAAVTGPRVSIIIRTYNRPALLRRAIASVAAQTYRDVEIVVVNNGGEDVREIVAEAAGGRPFLYEVMTERQHISAASNAGARSATGAYIGYLDDDDLIYADHCSRAVEVLERTRADAAFTLCLAEYARMQSDEKSVLGYQIFLDREFDLDDLHVRNATPIHTVVHRRDVFERFGYFDESLPVTDDWEFWLRIACGGAQFVRIDRVTCEYSWRYDPSAGNMTVEHQWDFVHAYRNITERYAPNIVGRAKIKTRQQEMLQMQERRAADAADPEKRARVVIESMSASLVPVAPIEDL